MHFNPRSREGSDGGGRRTRAEGEDFNPRSREGSDETPVYLLDTILDISIHAPAKGATTARSLSAFGTSYFNPRSREGSDSAVADRSIEIVEFQSTLPRRERPRVPVLSPFPCNFNPRSREGSDALTFSLFPSSGISIHAPAKGATHVRKYDHCIF